MTPVTVIGLGNREMGDDAIGLRLVEMLRHERESGEWKPAAGDGVGLVAAGNDSMLAAAHIAEGGNVIVLDAARMGRSPGDCRVFSAAAVLRGFNLRDAAMSLKGSGCSTHEAGLADALVLAHALGGTSNVRVFAVQIDSVLPRGDVSPRVSERIPRLLSRIKEEVELLS